MQFTTIVATAFALVAGASAQTYGNATTPVVPANVTAAGTGSPSGTGAVSTSSATFTPDSGAGQVVAGSAMGLFVIGGIAMAL